MVKKRTWITRDTLSGTTASNLSRQAGPQERTSSSLLACSPGMVGPDWLIGPQRHALWEIRLSTDIVADAGTKS